MASTVRLVWFVVSSRNFYRTPSLAADVEQVGEKWGPPREFAWCTQPEHPELPRVLWRL